ncbi:hypothetical protein [Reichenbachiella sp.]|uniref:hypothetical protein n=1 Tax=Reichenbachiella sp. TaxID=2184521 RepID=UPI003BAFE31F
MNNDKILIILEQLVKGIDELKVKLDSDKPEPQTNDISNELKRFDGLEEYQTLINQNLIKLGQRFRGLEEEVNMWEPINNTLHHHEHVFFPGILAWLDGFKRWVINLILIGLLLISLALNVEWHDKMTQYKIGHLKYYLVNELGMKVEKLEDYYTKDPETLLYFSDSVMQRNEEKARIHQQIESLKKKERELNDR